MGYSLHSLAAQGPACPGEAKTQLPLHRSPGLDRLLGASYGRRWHSICIPRTNPALRGPTEEEGSTASLAWLPRACAFLERPVMEEAGTESQGCLPRNCSALGGKPLKREHSFLVLQVLAMQVIKEGVYASHGRGGAQFTWSGTPRA